MEVVLYSRREHLRVSRPQLFKNFSRVSKRHFADRHRAKQKLQALMQPT